MLLATKTLQRKTLTWGAARAFTTPTQECREHLNKLGLWNKNIVHNPT